MKPTACCVRCGLRRIVKPERPGSGMCRDCTTTEPGWPLVTITATPRMGRPLSAKCGTNSGYYRHLRSTKNLACDECLQAHADYKRRRGKAA